jgi:hypothetical protein
LFVRPAVDDAAEDEQAVGAGTDGGPRVGCPLVGGEGVELGEPLDDHVAELGHHLGRLPRAPDIDPGLGDAAEVVADPRGVGRGVLELGPPRHARLEGGDVGQLILDRPAWAIRRQVPVGLVELVDQAVDRRPDLGQQLDGRRLIGPVRHGGNASSGCGSSGYSRATTPRTAEN